MQNFEDVTDVFRASKIFILEILRLPSPTAYVDTTCLSLKLFIHEILYSAECKFVQSLKIYILKNKSSYSIFALLWSAWRVFGLADCSSIL